MNARAGLPLPRAASEIASPEEWRTALEWTRERRSEEVASKISWGPLPRGQSLLDRQGWLACSFTSHENHSGDAPFLGRKNILISLWVSTMGNSRGHAAISAASCYIRHCIPEST